MTDYIGRWFGYGRPGPAPTHHLEDALQAVCRMYAQRDQAGTRAAVSLAKDGLANFVVATRDVPESCREMVAATVMAKLDDIAQRKVP